MRLAVVLIVFGLPQCAFAHRGMISAETEARLRKVMPGGDLEGRLQKLKQFRGARTADIEAGVVQQIDTQYHTKLEPLGDSLLEVNDNLGITDYFLEGDIQLTEEQLDNLLRNSSTTRQKRQMTSVYPRWTNGVLYYTLDSTLNDRKKTSINSALSYITARTCLTFVNSATAPNRVRAFNGDGCWSYVGMVGGEQLQSIGDGCESMGTVAHEFMHAIGSFHEQSRSDRDTAVKVDLTYVASGNRGQFAKETTADTVNYSPYEYGSVMHYEANSFTSGGQISISPLTGTYLYTMGSRSISFFDIYRINRHYGCLAKCPNATSAKCENNGYPNPNHCQSCVCPIGFGGALCDTRPAYGIQSTATAAWQEYTSTYGSNITTVRDTFINRVDWIYAPSGKRVQFGITGMTNSACILGCSYNGIEVKVNANPSPTGIKFCCPTQMNTIYTSNHNPTIVNHYNRYQRSSFTIKYRYV